MIFFISTLTIKNVTLEEYTAFPILFHLHKTKRMERHEEFFQIAEKLFNLTELENVPICTDREKAIIEPIKKLKLNLVLCTSHLKNDVKRFVSEKRAKNLLQKIDGDLLIQHITDLINSANFVQFKEKCDKFNEKLESNPTIINYLNTRIVDDIRNSSALFKTSRF